MKIPDWKLTLGFGLLAVYLLSGIYMVGSDEMGVLLLCGKVVADRVPPGIHYRLPWPLTTLKTPKVSAIRRMSIGYEILKQVQGLPPSRDESERLTGDMNVVNVALMVQYTIREPAQYLFETEAPDFLIRKAGEAFLCERIGTIKVDDLLTTSKTEVEYSLRMKLQAFLDSVGAGLQIRSCNLQNVEPPTEVIEAFNDVARAKSNREKSINEAQTYLSELIPRARGQAEKITQDARAQAAARVSRAAGEVARFDKLLTQYKRNPSILRQRLFWDAVQVILTKARKVIIENDKSPKNSLRIIQPSP